MRTRIIAITNQKGGSGKTTTAVNLGACLAGLGKNILLVDIDPQAHTTTHLGFKPHEIEITIYDVLINSQPVDICLIFNGVGCGQCFRRRLGPSTA